MRRALVGAAGLGHLAMQLGAVVASASPTTDPAVTEVLDIPANESRAERRRREKQQRKELEQFSKRQRYMMGRNRYE